MLTRCVVLSAVIFAASSASAAPIVFSAEGTMTAGRVQDLMGLPVGDVFSLTLTIDPLEGIARDSGFDFASGPLAINGTGYSFSSGATRLAYVNAAQDSIESTAISRPSTSDPNWLMLQGLGISLRFLDPTGAALTGTTFQLPTSGGEWSVGLFITRANPQPGLPTDGQQRFTLSNVTVAPAPVSQVPEPATWMLLATGLGIAVRQTHRRRG
jgi:hypothetical protein